MGIELSLGLFVTSKLVEQGNSPDAKQVYKEKRGMKTVEYGKENKDVIMLIFALCPSAFVMLSINDAPFDNEV